MTRKGKGSSQGGPGFEPGEREKGTNCKGALRWWRKERRGKDELGGQNHFYAKGSVN